MGKMEPADLTNDHREMAVRLILSYLDQQGALGKTLKDVERVTHRPLNILAQIGDGSMPDALAVLSCTASIAALLSQSPQMSVEQARDLLRQEILSYTADELDHE